MKTVAIVQSSYVPWKGYFDLVGFADEVVLLEDVQFTRRDWRNRNRIKTAQGLAWLTIPVNVRGRYHQTIRETTVADSSWAARHVKSLRHSYGKASHFREHEPVLQELYARAARESSLTAINRIFLDGICGLLKIDTVISDSAEFGPADEPTERLVSICRQAGADRYLTGPSARAYIDEGRFARAGIEVAYMDYGGYPEYPQLHPPFEHGVTVVDLIVNTGADAPRYMKSF